MSRSSYPMHPVTAALTRAAEASIAENNTRLAALAKQQADAVRFGPSPTGINVKPLAPGANPWLASSWNLSQQALLTNRDPAAAARFKGEAGLDGIHVPTREDATRVQASGTFIAKSVAAVIPKQAATPALVPQAAPAPERDSTSASPETLALVRDALARIGATVPQREFLSLAENIEGRTRTDAVGRVEVVGSDGQAIIDWRATTETGRVVGYTVDKFLNVVLGIEPDAPVKTPPAPEPEPETPTPAPFVPLHVRAAQAHAAGPEAVAALMAERYGATR